MKTDINGCSICQEGQEQYETYLRHNGQQLVQYDYRHTNGNLFSTVSQSLEECRKKRDEWLKKIIINLILKNYEKGMPIYTTSY